MQRLEDLDGQAQSVADRLENAGSAGRSIGQGVAGGAGQGMDSLGRLGGALDSAGEAAAHLGDAGAEAGNRLRSSFENAAEASDSLGGAFAKNFSRAQEAGMGFGKSIRTGIAGAFDTAKAKAVSFTKGAAAGAKNIGSAFLHPVKTIQGKFCDAMKRAAAGVEDTEEAADDAGGSLEEMGQSGEGAGNALQSGLGGALKVIGAIVAAAAAVTGLTHFVSAALDANQAAKNIAYSFEQTFGDSAPDIQGWADNFSGAVHRSESEVKGFLTANQQLYEGMGVTGDAANSLSKITTSLAYDIGNFTGKSDAEALAQLQDAIGGNAQALSDLGVRLDDTTLKQTALGMGISGSLEDMDDATLAQVRLNAILEQTGELQGSASKSLGGYAGGVKALKSAWTDFLEKAGAKLAPTFDKLFGTILDTWPKIEPALMSFVELLAGGFEQAAPILADFASNLLPQLLGLAGDLLPVLGDIGGQILPVVSIVLGTVAQSMQPLLPLISTLASTLLPPLAQIFGKLAESLLPPVAKLFGALSPVIDALSPVLQVAASGIGLVADVVAGLIGWLTKGIDKLGEFAQSVKNSAVGQFVGGVGDTLSGWAGNVKSFFGGNAKGTDDFEGGWTRIHEAGDEMIQAKHSGGLAYLPRGSAVIPASKTEEILSPEEPVESRVVHIMVRPQTDTAQAAEEAPAPAPQEAGFPDAGAPVIRLPDTQPQPTPNIQVNVPELGQAAPDWEWPEPEPQPAPSIQVNVPGLEQAAPDWEWPEPQPQPTPDIQVNVPGLEQAAPDWEWPVPQPQPAPNIQVNMPELGRAAPTLECLKPEPQPIPEPRLEPPAWRQAEQMPQPWTPVVLEGNPLLKGSTEPARGMPEPPPKPDPEMSGKPPDASGRDLEQSPAPYPAASYTTKRILEININVSSPDGSVPAEVLEQFREIAREESRRAYREEQDAELESLAIQRGYAG